MFLSGPSSFLDIVLLFSFTLLPPVFLFSVLSHHIIKATVFYKNIIKDHLFIKFIYLIILVFIISTICFVCYYLIEEFL